MPGFRAFKDRITILLGGSVAGSKCKPCLIWHSENPRVCNHINKHTLPVYCRSNMRSCMIQLFLQEALLNCYASKLRKYR